MNFLAAPYRSYVLAFTLQSDEYPKAQAADLCEPYHYYRTQEIDGKKYIIAGGEDHKTGQEENPEERFQNLEDYVRDYFDVEKPSLTREIRFRFTATTAEHCMP